MDATRSRLRQITRPLHERLERRVDLERRAWTLADYRRLLETLWGFYGPIERSLGKVNWGGCDVGLSRRLKTAWIAADLIDLGADHASIGRLDETADLPELDEPAAGLGVLYVLEGSTLGGQVILRALKAQLGVSPERGGRFFGSYGADTGAMWRSYLTVLEKIGQSPRSAAAIERSALETFESYDRWFMRCHG